VVCWKSFHMAYTAYIKSRDGCMMGTFQPFESLLHTCCVVTCLVPRTCHTTVVAVFSFFNICLFSVFLFFMNTALKFVCQLLQFFFLLFLLCGLYILCLLCLYQVIRTHKCQVAYFAFAFCWVALQTTVLICLWMGSFHLG